MVEWHGKSNRKASGGLRRSINARDKYLSERGGDIANTTIAVGDTVIKIKSVKTRGDNSKSKALRIKNANVTDPKTNKTKVWEVTTVKENSANRQFARKNIMTKNAIIELKCAGETKLGRVTSRPGQSGTVSAVLLTESQTKEFLDRTAKAPSEHKIKTLAAKKEAKASETALKPGGAKAGLPESKAKKHAPETKAKKK
ncbi:MAG: 30S ribosomal protein S8e [Candidatus Micrarchaeota archaeon]